MPELFKTLTHRAIVIEKDNLAFGNKEKCNIHSFHLKLIIQNKKLEESLRELEIRKKYRSIFKDGKFIELNVEDGLLFFKRENQYGNVYVYVNNSSKRYVLKLPEKMQDILNDCFYESELEIQPNSYGILKKYKKNNH